MSVDISKIEKIIAEVAAAEIMPRFRKLESGDIEMKGFDDPVTVADKAAEEALIFRLQGVLPGSVFVGEESYAKDPRIISRFSGDEDVWVIDPIDGTRNFIEGRTEFGVIIALVRRKKTVAGWIHDPNTGDTLTAEQGGGVWLRGHKMRLAKHEKNFSSCGILGWGVHRTFLRLKAEGTGADLPEAERASASSFDYPRLFTGDVLFANSQAPRASFLLGVDTKPWDHMAGLFMLDEAKGYSANFYGKSYNMEVLEKTGLLSTKDRSAWESVRRIFKPVINSFINH